MPDTPEDVLKLAKDAGVQIVDLRFCDLPGIMQHFSMPVSQLTADGFADGYGFDGSSIRGFQAIHESDMLLIPDPSTAVLDPFREATTLNINCFIQDPITRESYSRDPRYIAKKAEERLVASGIADVSYWGPELEFFIFDEVRFDQNSHEGYYSVDSQEGIWNSGQPGSRGYRPRYKEGYFPVPPTDQFQDMRSEMILTMNTMGVDVEIQHHEVGTAGQSEIDMRFSPLLAMADKVMTYKYVVKSTAWKHGKTATFMPKPIFADNGSGMHVHSSLWKNGDPLFFDAAGYGGLSEMARHYVGGLLKHAPALLAFCAPTTNSYRRLVPGYEAPINLVYSQRNRSAACRIPMYSNSPKAKRVEFRCPDPSANPYLAFPAMLQAGLDGVLNKIEPPTPIDKDIYDLEPEEHAELNHVPGSLEAVLDALESDHAFLTEGGVFTEDLIETWIDYKRTKEVDAIRLRPHPWEFMLYYDI
ncbi:MAG: type I glutamate--ammonia ligase [Actinomycetota bacterium]